MKSVLIFLLFLSLIPLNVIAQNDQEAISILDRFADKALKAPSVSMKFELITLNQTDKTKDSLAGSIILNKDKYKLELPDNIVWFNGEISWSYLPAEKEVTITKADKKDNSFQNRPSLVFSMYKKGYKSRLIEERSDSYLIDLYPEDIKGDLLRVRLTIGKPRLDLISLEYKRRDGVTITLRVKEYNMNVKPDAGTFIFNPEKFKDAEVIDMR